jgi:hypothetical protein
LHSAAALLSFKLVSSRGAIIGNNLSGSSTSGRQGRDASLNPKPYTLNPNPFQQQP